MGFTRTYPDGSILTSSALSQTEVETQLQLITAQLMGLLISPLNLQITLTLGLPTGIVNSSKLLYPGVTVTGTGIPANTIIISISGDIITLSNNSTTSGTFAIVAQDLNAPQVVRIGWQEQGQPGPSINSDSVAIIAQPIDHEFSRLRDSSLSGDSTTIINTDKSTRIWQVKWMFYGPNSLTNARVVVSAWIKVSYIDSFLADSNLFVNPDVKEPGRSPENFQGQWWERVNMEAELYEEVTETLTVGTVGSVEVKLYTKDGKLADFVITE